MSCRKTTCVAQCCNYQGDCPDRWIANGPYNTPLRNCVIYYKDIPDPVNPYIYVGAGFGGLFLLIAIISIICYCYRKKKAIQFLQHNRSMPNDRSTIQLTEQSINPTIKNYNQPMAPSYYLKELPSMNPQLYQPYPKPNYGQRPVPYQY